MIRKVVMFWSLLMVLLSVCKAQVVTMVIPEVPHQRVSFGIEKLTQSLEAAGYEVQVSTQQPLPQENNMLLIGALQDASVIATLARKGWTPEKIPGKEGFTLRSDDRTWLVAGADASGTLYGCLELADRVRALGALPADLNLIEAPEMVLRGACIGVQKTTYLPGRQVYEYPYTPENFPWFYDKELWVKYLDMLVENRMNSLYLWNGHPFASLVKLEDYPYAVEVNEETFKKNEEIFKFLTEEADKRGIWVIQMFYNIIVSKPFAEKHGIKTQDRQRPIIPLIADYTQKSIAAFVEKYPNVGLLLTLGEAMSGDENDVKWFTKTIIPGVKDGLKARGETTEPPIVVRGHDTNPQLVMEAALPLYKNLYTMSKYNGEALTTYEPRGPWAELHRDLSRLGSTHIDNVHILANLEPFRYGSADFIQRSIQAMHSVHGANGLHLFPQASYWDWPYTADKTSPRLLQIDRDWIWYKAWGRYAWNCHRDREGEIAYWTDALGEMYGCGEHGKEILEAYEQSGEIAPKLLRRFGITNGNRQTLTLGMTMSQLVNPYKWRVWEHLYDSDGPEGEKLIEYAEKAWNHEKHIGETPPQIIKEVVQHGQRAVQAINRAAPHVKKNKEEFSRLRNDMYAYQALADFFAEKVKAAMLVLRYQYSEEIGDLEQAVPHLEQSIAHYKKLVALTEDAYLYANSMQTAQRRIPISGVDGKNKTCKELLPHYAQELETFKKNIALLKSPVGGPEVKFESKPLEPVSVKLLHTQASFYPVEGGKKIFRNEDYVIQEVAGELKNMKGLKFSMEKQIEEGTDIHFRSEKPVKVLVGYFDTGEEDYLSPPDLETDASANNRGQAEVAISHAMLIPGLPSVNIHTYYFEPGEHQLSLDEGTCLVLGFIDGAQQIKARDAGFSSVEYRKGVDWLFY